MLKVMEKLVVSAFHSFAGGLAQYSLGRRVAP